MNLLFWNHMWLERLNPCVSFICTLAVIISLSYTLEKICKLEASRPSLSPWDLLRNFVGDNAFWFLSLANSCLLLHVNKVRVNQESFGKQCECCPFISSPGALIKYPRGPHLVGNKIQSDWRRLAAEVLWPLDKAITTLLQPQSTPGF